MANVSASGGEGRRTGQAGLPLPSTKKGLKGFFKDVSLERKKVSWPTRPETMRLTGVVLGVCGLLVVVLTVLSTLFETIIGLIVGKAV